MVGKNNQYIQKIKQGTKVETYSIKKFKVGIASVAIGCSVFFGAGVAMAGEQISGEQAVSEVTISKDTSKTEPKSDTETVTEKQTTTTKVEHNATQPNAISEEKETEKPKAIVNTKKLEDLLSEIDKLNLSNYTEESVKALQEKVAQAKEVLTNAKTQKEIDSSYNALVAYKNSGLKRVPKLKEGETPKPDTTNGKETLGKKAENTEPNGTNIAGHNHSMNRTNLPEGSGFRAAPNNEHFRYETTGADLSTLVAGEELGYGKNVIIKIKYDQGTVNKSNIQFSSYPNVGPRIEYTKKRSDGIGPYEDNGINIKLVGTLPNSMIGTYKLHLHILDRINNNRELATLEIPITVKPKKPTVKVDDLKNAEGKTPTVTANVANTDTSKAIFYLNGNEQSTVNASNGIATWTPTAPLKVNDVITVKNIAKAGIAPTDAYGNTFTINEVESDMSDAVTIPKAATKAKTNKAAAIEAIEAEVTKQNGVIEGNNGLTSEEKTSLKQAVSDAATTAKAEINKAETDTDAKVTTAKETGILAINKAEAIAEIKVALEAKEKATDEDKSLTKGQKTSIKEIAKKEAMAATVKIKSATTNKEVEEAKNEGIEKIKAAYAKNAELAAELTLPKLIITKWEDEEGNELRPADAKAPAEPGEANEALAHGEIAGYEFVATRDAGEVVTHIFRKLPKKSPIVEERQLPVVEKVNTKTVLPNTGANTTNTGLAGLGLSVLGAVLMTARQRRKNK